MRDTFSFTASRLQKLNNHISILYGKYPISKKTIKEAKNMFERKIYKKQALEQLKNHWKEPVLITLVTSVCLIIDILISEVFPLVNIIYPIIIGTIYIAISYYYLAFVKDNNNSKFSTFLQGCNLWGKGTLGFLWCLLWSFLWFLLFFIPGIIKSIAYSQMFVIMAENPKIGVCKAMKISMKITRGYKGKLFVMELSFLGWIFLALLPSIILAKTIVASTNMSFTFFSTPPLILGMSIPCIGYLWLYPYMLTSFTYAYHYMKQDAIDRGVLTSADFESNEQISVSKP